MSTEYRRGIPSTAHVEAATRLGLLWGDNYSLDRRWHFEIRDGVFHSDFESPDVALGELRSGPEFWMLSDWVDLRPIRPDGTPVDWEVLDQEVARVGQPVTVTPTASATPTTQPQGFRADLWQRLCEFILSTRMNSLSDIADVNAEGIVGESAFLSDRHLFYWQAMGLHPDSSEVQTRIARWTVYQELKPLYDLVDGAQGSVPMPADVEAAWMPGFSVVGYYLSTTARGNLCASGPGEHDYYPTDGTAAGMRLRNFAAVLDAVAERRVAERMRGQTRAPTVTSQPEPRRFADVRPDRHGWRWWLTFPANADDGLSGRADFNRRIEIETGNYRWLDESAHHQDFGNLRAWNDRTVIPTDEQGNPVSWEAAGFAVEAVRPAQETVQRAANDATPSRSVGDIEWTVTGQPVTRDMTVEPATGMVRSTHTARIRQLDRFVTEAIQAGNFSIESRTPPRPGQFSNNPATTPLTPEGFQQALETAQMAPGLYQETLDWVTRQVLAGAVIGVDTAKAPPTTTLPLPLPRFTADELDDVDHSKPRSSTKSRCASERCRRSSRLPSTAKCGPGARVAQWPKR